MKRFSHNNHNDSQLSSRSRYAINVKDVPVYEMKMVQVRMKFLLLLSLAVLNASGDTNKDSQAEAMLRIVFDYHDKDGDGSISSPDSSDVVDFDYWGSFDEAYDIYGDMAAITAYEKHMADHAEVITERILTCGYLNTMSFEDFKYLYALNNHKPAACVIKIFG